MVFLNNVINFFLLKDIRATGPIRYLLPGSCFFFITIAALLGNLRVNNDLEVFCLATRAMSNLQISPLILYLYLKPLYSIRGGSTTRAEPLTKNPTEVTFLWNPL